MYESQSYWDKEKKQPRSRRRLIGKRDPETGEIVPTRRRGARKAKTEPSDTDVDYRELYEGALEDARARDSEEVELRRRLAALEIEVDALRGKLDEVRRIVG